jgi:hypothetical protein
MKGDPINLSVSDLNFVATSSSPEEYDMFLGDQKIAHTRLT